MKVFTTFAAELIHEVWKQRLRHYCKSNVLYEK